MKRFPILLILVASLNALADTSALIKSARAQIGVTKTYNPGYKKLSYPGGDVPKSEGVCTDVIIRAFRGQNIDLQKLVHEDMRKNWSKYPKIWGLKKPDTNIDHRRVPNLVAFFKSVGAAYSGKDVIPGDVLVWDIGKGVLHIGIVTDKKSGSDYLAVHNICCGALEEDILTLYKKMNHFRFTDKVFKKLKEAQNA